MKFILKGLSFFFQPLLKSQANGKIVLYNIVVENQDRPTESVHYSVGAPALGTQLSLDPSSYKIHITASNSVGESPESVMILSNNSGHGESALVKLSSFSRKILEIVPSSDILNK